MGEPFVITEIASRIEAHQLSRDPRVAGEVRRYHTWRTLQTQTVGLHTWQNLRILLAIWPDVPRHVIVEMVFHDVGELGSGDLPYPSKARNSALKIIVDELEYDKRLSMCAPWGVSPPRELQSSEHKVLKLAEYIEMWEFSLTEIELGNRQSIHDCLTPTEELIKELRAGAEEWVCIAVEAERYIELRKVYHDRAMRDRSYGR